MSEPLTAAQIATETMIAAWKTRDNQELQWLREEIRELRQVLWAVVETAGGEVCVSDKLEAMSQGPGCSVESFRDGMNRCFVLKSRSPYMKNTG